MNSVLMIAGGIGDEGILLILSFPIPSIIKDSDVFYYSCRSTWTSLKQS